VVIYTDKRKTTDMANSLTFTSAPFLQAATFSSATSANTKYDILAVDATNARRIYGLSITSTDTGAQTVKFHLNDGVNTFQLFTLNVPLNSGATTSVASVDAFASVYGSSVFSKQRDANGVPYFNIPATWKMQMEYNPALGAGEQLFVFTFGETYA
jgi:hypothetical protein